MRSSIISRLNLTHIRSFLTFMMAIIYLVNYFLQSVWVNHLILVLIIAVIILSLTVVTGSSKIIGYVSISCSVLILTIYQAPFKVWEQAIEGNLYLVVLFALVPLLRIPIQFGGYYEALQGFFRRFVNTYTRFYLLVSFISAFIGVLVNLAVVPLVHEISKASDFSSNKRLLSKAITRGFTTTTIWAPTMASIALIIQLSGAQWHSFFPYGILCGLLAGAIGFVITITEEKNIAINIPENGSENDRSFERENPCRINYSKVLELSIFGIILIAMIAVISILSGVQTIVIVSIASLIFPVVWLILLRRLPVLFREFKGEYFHRSLPNLKNEMILFVGAGLFASSITFSGLGSYVPQVLTYLVGDSIILLSGMVIVISLILAILGVHPIVTVTIIGGTVKASAYGISSTYMAVLLAVCWAIGISISPSAANIIAVSGLAEESPIDVGPRWNGRYALITSAVLLLVMTVLRWLHFL